MFSVALSLECFEKLLPVNIHDSGVVGCCHFVDLKIPQRVNRAFYLQCAKTKLFHTRSHGKGVGTENLKALSSVILQHFRFLHSKH